MYQLVGCFRALVLVDEATGKYSWKKSPLETWEVIGAKLVAMSSMEKQKIQMYLLKIATCGATFLKRYILRDI